MAKLESRPAMHSRLALEDKVSVGENLSEESPARYEATAEGLQCR